MAGTLAILRRLAMAVLAGLYWMATGSLGFWLTGSDPLDTLNGNRPVAAILLVWGTVAAGVIVFAVADRAIAAAPRGRLAPSLAKGAFSAAFWFGALYVAGGLFLGDRLGPDGIVGPPVVIPFWLFLPATLAIYATFSSWWDRRPIHHDRTDR